MKLFFMIRKSQQKERGLLPVMLVVLLGALLSAPQTVICMSGLSLIQKTCESAEKTVPPLALRGIATIIEKSNEHKVLGGVVVGLASVGALYILTRPYAWANGQADRAERKAERVEKKLLQQQCQQLEQEKERLQVLLGLEQ